MKLILTKSIPTRNKAEWFTLVAGDEIKILRQFGNTIVIQSKGLTLDVDYKDLLNAYRRVDNES